MCVFNVGDENGVFATNIVHKGQDLNDRAVDEGARVQILETRPAEGLIIGTESGIFDGPVEPTGLTLAERSLDNV